MVESYPQVTWERLPDSLIAWMLDAKLVLMGGAPERFMLRRMQSQLHPGTERALMALSSIALTVPVIHAPSSSSTQEFFEWLMSTPTGMDPERHYSSKLGLVSISLISPHEPTGQGEGMAASSQ
jgi:hypothetical protein